MKPRFLLASICVLSLSAPVCAQDWKLDVIVLKNGQSFEGLLVEETKEAVQFKYVVRKPGARTVVVSVSFSRDEISRITRISDDERKELGQRLDQLDPLGEREESRKKALKLDSVRWNNADAWQYQGSYFTLVSNARADLVRTVIVRLEDIFEAYMKNLGTRRQPKPNQLTHISLFKSLPEYHAALKGTGMNILNPAYYDPQKNEIVAASDFERLAEELDKLRQKHDALLQDLETQEKRLRKHFMGTPPPAMVAQLRQVRQDIQVINNENRSTFERLNRPFFAMLYHEAFHAYLDNFVYPATEGTIPRWLNEGLAQIYETALVETGELRVGHVDEKRLVGVKDAIRKKQLVPLSELLASDWKKFHVAHGSDALASDRFFQTSWALAYYLTFDRKLLGSKALDRYVEALGRDTNKVEAFTDLAGQPLPEFEKQFHEYLLNLRADGTVARPMERK